MVIDLRAQILGLFLLFLCFTFDDKVIIIVIDDELDDLLSYFQCSEVQFQCFEGV